jgi:uncharacterized Zn-binding protein involved in type VI secretion
MHVCPLVTGVVPHVGGPITGPGCPTVLEGGLLAARSTDLATCVGPPDSIALGSPSVYIGSLMAARLGDLTVHGGSITLGLPTVQIGGAVATAVTAGGVMTVTWGAFTIRGAPADVAALLNMLNDDMSHNDTGRALMATLTSDTANPVNITLVRGDPTVWVDAFFGNGNHTINMDYFDGTEYPHGVPGAHPDSVTRGENLVHGLDEAHQGAVLQNTRGADPAGGNWYTQSHAHAINAENQYRANDGQTSNLVSSNGGPGPNDVTFQFDNGANEVHDQNTHAVTRHDAAGNVIP